MISARTGPLAFGLNAVSSEPSALSRARLLRGTPRTLANCPAMSSLPSAWAASANTLPSTSASKPSRAGVWATSVAAVAASTPQRITRRRTQENEAMNIAKVDRADGCVGRNRKRKGSEVGHRPCARQAMGCIARTELAGKRYGGVERIARGESGGGGGGFAKRFPLPPFGPPLIFYGRPATEIPPPPPIIFP